MTKPALLVLAAARDRWPVGWRKDRVPLRRSRRLPLRVCGRSAGV